MELLNTELDAVNLCLAGIGREPVATVDTSDLDAAMALSTVQRASLDIQMNRGRGWWFNQEIGWNFTPDSRGNLTVPNNTLTMLEARCGWYDQGNRLTLRGFKIYDTERHTFDLREIVGKDGAVELGLIVLLEYNELPPNARSAIAWRARRIFSDDTVGDPNQRQANMREEQNSFASLEMENRKNRRSNYFKDNAMVKNQVGRIGGLNNLY